MNESFWKWFFKGVKAAITCFFEFSWLRSTILECSFGILLTMLGSIITIVFRLYWLIPLCIIVGIIITAHGKWRYDKGEQ